MILGGVGTTLNSQGTSFVISSESAKFLAEAFSPRLSENTLLDFLSAGFGAFAGAFFAFLFVRLGDFLVKLHQRKVKHYNALVAFEGLLNDYLGIIHDNIYLIKPFVQAITSGNLYWSTLKILPIDKGRLSDLYNLELINEINDYFVNVRKLNDDVEGITSAYIELKNALIQKNIDRQTYVVNAYTIAENLLVISAFSEKLQDDTLQALAKIRISMRRGKSISSRIIEYIANRDIGKIGDEIVKKEVKKLKKELEDTARKSRSEIEKIKKRLQQNK